MNRINKPGSKRAFFRRKLELPILSRSGNIKFQVAWSEKLKMWQNVAKSGDASRRKGQNSRLGLTAKVFPQWAWKLSSSLYRPQFYSKLENFPSHFPRIFHGLLPKRMKAKNGLGCFWNRGLSCPTTKYNSKGCHPSIFGATWHGEKLLVRRWRNLKLWDRKMIEIEMKLKSRDR